MLRGGSIFCRTHRWRTTCNAKCIWKSVIRRPSSQVLAITSLQICQLPLIASAKPYRSTSRLFRSIAFGRGGTRCRRHLAAHELVVRSAEPVDPSRLTPVVGQMLRDLVDTFNVFIVGDPKGRELDQIRLGPRERAAATTIIDAALPIVDAIRESQGVVTAAAFEALAEQLEAARNVASGIDGDLRRQ